MTENEILNSIKGNVNVSFSELEKLFSASASAIDYLLNEKASVEISDFGVFSRKTNNQVISNSFKPTERLKERINQR